MSKFLKKPSSDSVDSTNSRFQKFNLKENPFPSEPIVNKESQDKRINGDIYENQIREKERERFIKNFVKPPQSDPSHIRLGYLVDTSYIGRGNGKSAFLINLINDINREFCLDISDGKNKCFGLYVQPEAGGRSKTFPKFLDNIFESILDSRIIDTCLATLRLEAISLLDPDHPILDSDEVTILKNLNSEKWFNEQNFSVYDINQKIVDNPHLQHLPPEFPLFNSIRTLAPKVITQKDFKHYYSNTLKKGKPKFEFLFSHLIRLFRSANFNGAYLFVDDFERIPDFQSTRQKKDFALELRTILYDGTYHNAKIGFFNMILVLHAGVERLISDAWSESGMENRAPISPPTTAKHIIPFDKLNKDHAILLLNKYLKEYRITNTPDNISVEPFTEEAVGIIGEYSEYNAAKILKSAYDLLDSAATASVSKIDKDFINRNKEVEESATDRNESTIDSVDATNLVEKAMKDDDK